MSPLPRPPPASINTLTVAHHHSVSPGSQLTVDDPQPSPRSRRPWSQPSRFNIVYSAPYTHRCWPLLREARSKHADSDTSINHKNQAGHRIGRQLDVAVDATGQGPRTGGQNQTQAISDLMSSPESHHGRRLGSQGSHMAGYRHLGRANM